MNYKLKFETSMVKSMGIGKSSVTAANCKIVDNTLS